MSKVRGRWAKGRGLLFVGLGYSAVTIPLVKHANSIGNAEGGWWYLIVPLFLVSAFALLSGLQIVLSGGFGDPFLSSLWSVFAAGFAPRHGRSHGLPQVQETDSGVRAMCCRGRRMSGRCQAAVPAH